MPENPTLQGSIASARHRSAVAIWAALAGLAMLLLLLSSQASQPGRVALYAGMLCASGTALGGLSCMVLPFMQVLNRYLLALGAGIMLAALAFSLLGPALALQTGTVTPVLLGLVAGALVLLSLDWCVNKVWQRGGREDTSVAGMLLLAATLTLHNLPEGLAIGFAAVSEVRDDVLAWGIAAQNVPEGYLVGYAVIRAGFSRATGVAAGIASGLVEPLAAVVATWWALSEAALAGALACAAGAMLAALMALVMPAIAWHDRRHRRWLAGTVCIGFAVLMALDGWLS